MEQIQFKMNKNISFNTNFSINKNKNKNNNDFRFNNNNNDNNFINDNLLKNFEVINNLKINPCKIGILVPTSNKGKNWLKAEDTFLFNLLIRSFLNTTNDYHEYIFYIGIDADDKIWTKIENFKKLLDLKNKRKNIEFKIYNMKDIPKGHVTKMWNKLFKLAYDENCHYFLQCGDDIEFKSIWIDDAIKILLNNNNFGLTGPVCNNAKILTQTFVSRKHMNIFGFFFPPNIKNWYCDDWINEVYKPNYYFPLLNKRCENLGGEPRYSRKIDEILVQKDIADKQVNLSKDLLSKYLSLN